MDRRRRCLPCNEDLRLPYDAFGSYALGALVEHCKANNRETIMALSTDWWGNMSSEDYIRTEPNPLPHIKRLNAKNGLRYVDRQQLPCDRGLHGRPDRVGDRESNEVSCASRGVQYNTIQDE